MNSETRFCCFQNIDEGYSFFIKGEMKLQLCMTQLDRNTFVGF